MKKAIKNLFEECRRPKKEGKLSSMLLYTLGVFLIGCAMGAASKWLDTIPSNELTAFLQSLDIANLFGMVPVWALFAIAVSVFCDSPLRAGVNACVYFAGVVLSYWVCSILFAGFMMDYQYLLIWVAFTLFALPLGFILWYARGTGIIATAVTAAILAYYLLAAFSFDSQFSYFDLKSGWIGVAFIVFAAALLYVRLPQTLEALTAAAFVAYFAVLTGIHFPYLL